MISMSSSIASDRERSSAPRVSPSRSRGAVLAGKSRLEGVMNFVLVQVVVRGRRGLLRPHAGDAEIAGEPAPATWNRGPLAFGGAAEVCEQRPGRVEVGHGLAEFGGDELGGAPGKVS